MKRVMLASTCSVSFMMTVKFIITVAEWAQCCQMVFDNAMHESANVIALLMKPSLRLAEEQCDHKKMPNVYKSCPKMISLEK